MADRFTKSERSRIMATVRARGNKATELVLVRLFRQARLTGWRRHPVLPGRPDFIFPTHKIAIFVDGCFWHGCKKHCRMPASNRSYWSDKIARNMERDRLTRKLLKSSGWRVISIWEHELRSSPLRVMKKITAARAKL